MRAIKFRAWEVKENKMIGSWDALYCLAEGKQIGDPERFIFMQFTGLKDKNGKEIYEGDVVKHRFHDTKPPFEVFEVGRIIWNHENCRFSWYSDGGDGYGMQEKDDEYREVVGNIWEHGELLKK